MNKSILSATLAVLLSGCVVAPYRYPVNTYPQPVYQQQEVIVYPQVESAYVWDPFRAMLFFSFGGSRHYMDRGWNYRSHGAPRGYYRR